MKSKLLICLLSILCFSTLGAELVNISEITELLSVETLDQQGTIKNIKMAPFNKDLISFELWNENNDGVALYLFNRSKKKVLKIESATILNSKKRVPRPKDYNFYWHPTENWFLFNGNAGNRMNLYACRIADEALNNKFALKGSIINFKEMEDKDDEDKKLRAAYSEPTFSSDGQTIFFIRKVLKKGETATLCKSMDFDSAKENKFEDISFEVIAKKNFDISNPLPSPKSGSNLVAFCANQNKLTKKDKDPYLDYSINVINADTKDEVEVNNCDGFSVYSLFWNKNGDFLYYYKAIPREKTSQEDLNNKFNVLNLYATKIIQSGNKVISIPQSNQKTDVILENVSDRGLVAVDDANLLVPVFNESLYSIVAINLDHWRNKLDSYHEIVELKYPAYYPQYINNELVYVNYKTTSDDNFIDMISTAKVKLNFPSGSKTTAAPPIASQPVINKSRNEEKNIVAKTDTNKEIPQQQITPPVTVVKPPETVTPQATNSNQDFLPAVMAVLKNNSQLTLQEIFAKLNIPIDNKDAIAKISLILRENAEISTLGTKRFFSLKKPDAAPTVAENLNAAELLKLNAELKSLQDRNVILSTELELNNKDKASQIQSETDYTAEKNKKLAEIKSLEQTNNNIREAGSNQIAILSAQLEGLNADLQTNSLELTKTYDEIALSQNSIKEMESTIVTSNQNLPKLQSAIENLKKEQRTAQDNAIAAEQKAMEEEAAKAKLEAETTAQAEAKMKAEQIAKAKAEEEAVKSAKQKALDSEYTEEVEDEYTDETEDDVTVSEPVTPPPKAQPASIKKRR